MGKMFFGCTVLAAIVALSIFHCSYVTKNFTLMEKDISHAQSLSELGQQELAKNAFDDALDRWESMELYVKIFICNSDVDSAEEAFYDYMGSIYSGETGVSRGHCEKLLSLLDSISGSEKPILKNIL